MYRYDVNLNRKTLRTRLTILNKKIRGLIAPAVLVLALFASPLGVLAKGGSLTPAPTPSPQPSNVADIPVAAISSYYVIARSVNFNGNTMSASGSASVSNFAGREDEQYIKFVWGDGTSESDKLMNLPGYLKSSKTLTISNWSRNHTYASDAAWQVNIRIYQGTQTGSEVAGNPLGQFSFGTENTATTCNDGVDNDKDGPKDLFDSDCAKFRVSESTAELCGDGIDNDISGMTDLYDATCAAFIPKEDNQAACSDGVDNDLDGKIDLMDADCAAFIPKEDNAAACSDRIDNDLDGKTDLYDMDCAAFRPTENNPTVCTDGIDNDYDGLVDGRDSDCAGQTPLENNATVCLDGIDNDFDGKFDWQDSDCAAFVIPANCPVGFQTFFFPGFGFICAASAGY